MLFALYCHNPAVSLKCYHHKVGRGGGRGRTPGGRGRGRGAPLPSAPIAAGRLENIIVDAGAIEPGVDEVPEGMGFVDLHVDDISEILHATEITDEEGGEILEDPAVVPPLEDGDVVAEGVEVPEAVVPEVAVDINELKGPSGLGYFYNTRVGRSVGRYTPVFNRSVKLRCYVHPNCGRAVAEYKIPNREQMKRWLANAVPIPPGTGAADAKKPQPLTIKS